MPGVYPFGGEVWLLLVTIITSAKLAKELPLVGKNFEIASDDVKEFKVLDENSKPFKTSSVLKKTGGAVVGGLLTGGVGAIIGAMITGNKTKKDLKINLGFKLKNKDWFIATLDVEDKESFTGGMEKTVIEEVIKRFSVK